MKKDILLIGGGGHCKACIDVIEQSGLYWIAGIVETEATQLHKKVLGYEVIGIDEELPQLVKKYHNCLVTVGQIKTAEVRIRLYETLKSLGAKLPAVVSPLSYVSPHAKIGEGTIIMHNALINAGAAVGRNCIINTKALVEHDAFVADHCHIATAAVVNGGVKVATASFLGSGAVSREFVEIGENSVVGCGAKVTKNIPKTP
jgi:sugar O-acyltransferase (sialic acid O-acetyltransferase NeuD family)